MIVKHSIVAIALVASVGLGLAQEQHHVRTHPSHDDRIGDGSAVSGSLNADEALFLEKLLSSVGGVKGEGLDSVGVGVGVGKGSSIMGATDYSVSFDDEDDGGNHRGFGSAVSGSLNGDEAAFLEKLLSSVDGVKEEGRDSGADGVDEGSSINGASDDSVSFDDDSVSRDNGETGYLNLDPTVHHDGSFDNKEEGQDKLLSSSVGSGEGLADGSSFSYSYGPDPSNDGYITRVLKRSKYSKTSSPTSSPVPMDPKSVFGTALPPNSVTDKDMFEKNLLEVVFDIGIGNCEIVIEASQYNATSPQCMMPFSESQLADKLSCFKFSVDISDAQNKERWLQTPVPPIGPDPGPGPPSNSCDPSQISRAIKNSLRNYYYPLVGPVILGASFSSCNSLLDLTEGGNVTSISGSYVYLRNFVYEDKRIAQWSDKTNNNKCGNDDCLGTYEKEFNDDQLWVLEQLGSTDYYAIVNAVNRNSMIAYWGENDGGSGNIRFDFGIWDGNKDDFVYWKFEKGEIKDGAQYYYIVNKAYTDIKIAQYNTDNRGLVAYDGPKYDDQMWALVPQFYCGLTGQASLRDTINCNIYPEAVTIEITTGVATETTKTFASTTEISLSMEYSTSKASVLAGSAKFSASLTQTIAVSTTDKTTTSWSRKETQTFQCPPEYHCTWKQAQSSLSGANNNKANVYDQYYVADAQKCDCDRYRLEFKC